MKVKMSVNLKYNGKNYPPGTEVDVVKEVAEKLIENKQAAAIEKEKPQSGSGASGDDK
ncbi:hypothetical protein [Bacillus sp. CGMCC 1.16541]|uniref:DUF7210 family protein n=1 Tax=Bacillus sp. CGMCC 1.16541 TaxID=2185143 RepID=UPI0013A52C34|nr:hypothetical protein [Bacillus sp. CGMCC 1.16541]